MQENQIKGHTLNNLEESQVAIDRIIHAAVQTRFWA